MKGPAPPNDRAPAQFLARSTLCLKAYCVPSSNRGGNSSNRRHVTTGRRSRIPGRHEADVKTGAPGNRAVAR